MLKVTIRGLLAHKVRLIATAIAVLLGVAFMTGTQVLTSSISASFDKVFADVYASIDVVVRSTNRIETPFGDERTRISADVIPTISNVNGVADAQGQVVGQLRVLDKQGKPLVPGQGPPNFGLNWLGDSPLNGWTIVEGRAPINANDIVLDKKSAEDGSYSVGDQVEVSLSTGSSMFNVVGIAKFGKLDTWGGAQSALFQTEALQNFLGEPGKFNWISVAGKDGVSQSELQERISSVIPSDTEAVTGKAFTAESQDAFQKLISVFNTFLLVFALIALFVGSFIIYNTFSIIVAQRTRELALLRAIGASRRQVLQSVIVEALVVGLFASFVGAILGIGLAIGLNALLQQVGFSGPDTPIVIPPSALISSIFVGTFITVVSAIFPARRAASIPPVAAMRDIAIDRSGASRRRILIGVAMLIIGLGSLWLGLFGDTDNALQLVGAGAFFVFIGLTIIGPTVASPLSSVIGYPLQKTRGLSGRLARENAMRNPRRTSTTASALMIGIGLVGFIAVTAASIKASTVDAIEASVKGQYVVTSEGFGATALPEPIAPQLAAVNGVKAAAGIAGTFAKINNSNKVVLAVDPQVFSEAIDITNVEGSFENLGLNQVAISDKLAKSSNLKLGDQVPAQFLNTGSSMFTITSIYKTKFQVQGSEWIISLDQFNLSVPPELQSFNAVYILLNDTSEAGINAARQPLQQVVDQYPSAKLENLSEYKKTQSSQADQFLVIVYVLLMLALVIAIVGVINTLLLSVYERTREFGLLRAVGMPRRQVRSIVRLESVIISLLGALVGLGIGLLFGFALVTALKDEGVTAFAIPWSQLIIIVLLAALAGIGAALYPAWRASRLDVLRAISSE